MDEQTYEYIKQIKQDDDDEEEEEDYPNGDEINDDDWVRLFWKSDSANSVVNIYQQEQVGKWEGNSHQEKWKAKERKRIGFQ